MPKANRRARVASRTLKKLREQRAAEAGSQDEPAVPLVPVPFVEDECWAMNISDDSDDDAFDSDVLFEELSDFEEEWSSDNESAGEDGDEDDIQTEADFLRFTTTLQNGLNAALQKERELRQSRARKLHYTGNAPSTIRRQKALGRLEQRNGTASIASIFPSLGKRKRDAAAPGIELCAQGDLQSVSVRAAAAAETGTHESDLHRVTTTSRHIGNLHKRSRRSVHIVVSDESDADGEESDDKGELISGAPPAPQPQSAPTATPGIDMDQSQSSIRAGAHRPGHPMVVYSDISDEEQPRTDRERSAPADSTTPRSSATIASVSWPVSLETGCSSGAPSIRTSADRDVAPTAESSQSPAAEASPDPAASLNAAATEGERASHTKQPWLDREGLRRARDELRKLSKHQRLDVFFRRRIETMHATLNCYGTRATALAERVIASDFPPFYPDESTSGRP
ncbi:hypothetical protein EXIGLDRAFT_758758 [Exidia glandulosa HHB12029]|uniref:Uncharacterized protein n=1 Tax=Exidia glandulosa HHB12029 TaxID=1314781 RepID=A0A165R3Z9_EXIGL|nr:hypothetical protein EXIGLDRAFT_758758 [Exidia glandulosa HHB12029]